MLCPSDNGNISSDTQTQPVPNPLSYYFHQSPEVFHKFETLSNHFIELIVPWFLLLPGRLTVICGILQIIFQVIRVHLFEGLRYNN